MDILRIYACRFLDLARARLGERLPDEIADILNLADADVRHECGGERLYVAKTCEQTVMNAARRDVAIRKAWKDNEPIPIIAARHGLSRRMIYKIIYGR